MTRLSPERAYELWADTYDSDLNPLLALESRTWTALLEGLHPKQLLDVACGTGRWMLRYRRSGSKVFGVDLSHPMLAKAASRASLLGCLMAADAEHLPIRASFADLVLCSLSLGYFQNLEEVFSEFARVATPGAAIAVSDLHPEAVSAGWRRSFKRDGLSFEIEHYPHAVPDIEEAAKRAGLELRLRHTAYFGEPELPFFQAAGKESLLSTIQNVPALSVGIWRKRC